MKVSRATSKPGTAPGDPSLQSTTPSLSREASMLHRNRARFWLQPLAAIVAITLAVPLALPLTAHADDDDAAIPAGGTGVARVSVVEGSVAIGRGDSTAPVAAAINAPILAADYVTTGAQSRAEVQFDGKTMARLGENVQLRVAHLDNDERQLQLAAGTIDVRLLRGDGGAMTIDTPSISIAPRASGSYRIAVSDDGTSFVTIRSGRADIITPQGSQSLTPGSTLIAQGSAQNPQIIFRDAVGYDSFDTFNDQLDRTELAALSDSPYIDPGIGGVSDLGAYGNWVSDGSYGEVWIPTTVAVGWAPYRTGSWVWEDGYGWTWVAAEPWGWAPYHYGRWYFSSAYNRWAWYPPARAAAVPAWSPALVGFIGLSLGAVSVGVGFGSHIGWVPLAPHEAFHPWWGPHATAVNVTNVTNVTITNVTINQTYRNARYNGVSSVSVENFRAGHFGTAVAVTNAQLAMARPLPLRGALPVVPTASNLRFTAQPAFAGAAPPRPAVFPQRAFAGSATVAPRTPFVEQQARVTRITGAPAYERPAAVPPPTASRPSYSVPASSYERSATVAPPAAARPASVPPPTAARPAFVAPPAAAERPWAGRPASGESLGWPAPHAPPSYRQPAAHVPPPHPHGGEAAHEGHAEHDRH
jgi:hypothetical protein